MTPPFIQTRDALHALIEQIRLAPFLALDTEFVREETYYAKLCVIQVGDGSFSVCVDAIADLDLPSLFAAVAQTPALKVFHAPGQDLEIFVQRTGTCPTPLFDTQIAAALLGHGDQLGYAGLVEKLAGIKVDKSLSRTNWARRPLTAAELTYAADDVRHLARLYPQMEAELAARGRLEWLREDCARMTDPARYRPAPDNEWRRLKGLAKLERTAQHVAARLARWRDEVGELRDRPRKWILPDEALYVLAERQPQSRSQLADLGVLQLKTLERHADTLLALVAEGRADPRPVLAENQRPDDTEKTRIKRLAERLRNIATELEIPASLIAPRAELERLAAEGENADILLLRGWRRQIAGEELLRYL
ncbi:MAG: ribonuclease D [Panacagrimonas sp.]